MAQAAPGEDARDLLSKAVLRPQITERPLTVAYGALLRGKFMLGQSVLINGATGNIGACTVLLARTLGAARILCLGRNIAVQEKLNQLGSAVKCVALTGDIEADRETVQSMESGFDLVVDASASSDPASTELAIGALGYGGTAVLVGGVRANVNLSYTRMVTREQSVAGSYMYAPQCPTALVRLIESGILDLSKFTIAEFPLDRINEAITAAPNFKGLSAVVVQP